MAIIGQSSKVSSFQATYGQRFVTDLAEAQEPQIVLTGAPDHVFAQVPVRAADLGLPHDAAGGVEPRGGKSVDWAPVTLAR